VAIYSSDRRRSNELPPSLQRATVVAVARAYECREQGMRRGPGHVFHH